MKKFKILFFIFWIYLNAEAQNDYAKYELKINGGLSIPVGDYAKIEKSKTAGFAKTGGIFGLDVDFNVTQNFSVIGKYEYFNNTFNNDEFEKLTTANLQNQIFSAAASSTKLGFSSKIENSMWNISSFQVGSAYKLYIDKIGFNFYGTVGYASINSPSIFYAARITDLSNGDPLDFFVTSPSASSGSFCYSFGSEITYAFSNYLGMNLGIDFFGMKPDFHRTSAETIYLYSTINNNYQASSASQNNISSYTQSVGIVNTKLGLVFKFGKGISKKKDTNIVIEQKSSSKKDLIENSSIEVSKVQENKKEENKKQEIVKLAEDTPIQKMSIENKFYSINSNVVNLRSGPGKNFEIMSKISFGEIVEVIEKLNNEWWRVVYKGKIGYVSTVFLVNNK